MGILVKKKSINDEICVKLTRTFLDSLSKLDDDKNITDKNIRKALKFLNSSNEACMELYRHSLCLALNLSSNLAYNKLSPLVCICKAELERSLQDKEVLQKSEEFKRGFLEACTHCIVFTRNNLNSKGR